MRAFVTGLFLLVEAAALTETRVEVRTAQGRDKIQPPHGKYQAVAIVAFEVTSGLDVPTNYLATLSEELVTQILQTKKFRRVFKADQAVDGPIPTVRLTGRITEFTKGSVQKRFWVGFGAGQAKLRGHFVLRDSESGEVVLEGDADGKVLGLNDAVNVTRGLAKEIAQTLKRELF